MNVFREQDKGTGTVHGACTFFPCSYTLNPNDLGYNDHHKNN